MKIEFALPLALLVVLSGCAAQRLYPGDPRSPEQVALIEVHYPAKVSAVDGRSVEGNRFEVLPGAHSIGFTASRSVRAGPLRRELSARCEAKLDLAPGAVYSIESTTTDERVENPKAARGTVRRHELHTSVMERGRPIDDDSLECTVEQACFITWRYGSITRFVPCKQYDGPRFALRVADERVPIVDDHAPHCRKTSGADQIDCELEAASNVLFFPMPTGPLRAFRPADPRSANAAARDAARQACSGSSAWEEVVACLEDNGYVPAD